MDNNSKQNHQPESVVPKEIIGQDQLTTINVSQFMIKSGTIRPRHLVTTTTLNDGDMFYGTANNTFVNLSGGWIPSQKTWTYVSATTFLVPGDVSSIYKKGLKLQWKDSSVKYGIVQSSSYSTSTKSTTVTLVATSDYALVSSPVITNNYYSFDEYPTGWPGLFNYTGLSFTTSGGAFTNAPTLNYASYEYIGQTLVFNCQFTYNATSGGSGTVYISALPTTILSTKDVAGTGLDVTAGKSLNVRANSTNNRIEVLLYDGTTADTNSHVDLINIAYYV